MKRYEMIKDKRRFNYVIKNGKFVKDKNFVVYHDVASDLSMVHFGIAIKKSIGKAFLRNKLKRQTRVIIDNNKNLFKKGKDYIIMIRNGCLESDFDMMNKSIENLLKGNLNEKK